MAAEFEEVVASDISEEALRIAAQTVAGAGRVSFVRSDVEGIDVQCKFDVVMISEVLLFVKQSDGPRILDMLDRHLKPNGIIVEVANAKRPTNRKFFFDWDKIISSRFPILHRERHEDPTWPYEIVVYNREPARVGAGPVTRYVAPVVVAAFAPIGAELAPSLGETLAMDPIQVAAVDFEMPLAVAESVFSVCFAIEKMSAVVSGLVRPSC